MHRQNQVLKTGSYKALGAEKDYLSYGRFDGKSAVVVAVNTSDRDMEVSIPTWQLGIEDESALERLTETTRAFYNCGRVKILQKDGSIRINVKADSAVVYRTV